jgi:hypothetical protein
LGSERAISSNDPWQYPDDTPERLREMPNADWFVGGSWTTAVLVTASR